MSSRKIRGGKTEVEASIKDNIAVGLKRIKARLNSFAAGTAKVGGALFGTAVGALAPLAMSVNKFSDYGDEIAKMSRRTNIAGIELQTLGFAARRMGADLGTIERANKGLQKNLRGFEQGLSTQKKAFADLNLTMADFEGKTMDERLKLIADRMQNIDPNKRAALAMDVFGKAGQQLLPMLNEGAEGIEKLQQRAKDLGIPISEEDLEKSEELNDRLGELKEVVKGAYVQIGSALAPTVIKLVTGFIEGAKVVLDFVKKNKGLILGIAVGVVAIGALGAALLGVSFIAMGLSAGIGMISAILGFMLSPIGLVIGLIVALGAAFFYFTDAGNESINFIKGKLGELLDWGKKVFGGIQDAIAAGDWELAGKIMWTALKLAFQTGIGWIMTKWLDFKFGFLEVFDNLITSAKSAWLNFIEWVGRKISFLIDKANSISKQLTGQKLIALDGDTIANIVTLGNQKIQEDLRKAHADRLNKRDAAKREQLEGLGTEELKQELADLIQEAADKREEVEANRKKLEEKRKPELPEFEAPDLSKGLKSGSFGAFNAQLLGRFRTDTTARQQLKAAEKTAKNTAEIRDKIVNSNGLVVT